LRHDVATVVTALPKVLRDRAVLISAETPDSIVIELSGGAEVVWGSAESSAQKAQVIVALLSVKASVYDVSSPSHPTTKG
jgi:cell division protein FtsQ